MSDFSSDLQACLAALHEGLLVDIPGQAGRMLAADATNDLAVSALVHAGGDARPLVLLADERDLLQYVSALDLGIFDRFDNFKQPAAIVLDGLLGLSELLLDAAGSAPLALVRDEFNNHLIKRFRKPLAVILLNNPNEASPVISPAAFRAGDHTPGIVSGFLIEQLN